MKKPLRQWVVDSDDPCIERTPEEAQAYFKRRHAANGKKLRAYLAKLPVGKTFEQMALDGDFPESASVTDTLPKSPRFAVAPAFFKPGSMTPDEIRARLEEIYRQDDIAPVSGDAVWWSVLEVLELEDELERLTDSRHKHARH